MCHKDIKINIGGGRIIHKGYINIDITGYIDGRGNQVVDIIRDIETHGLPFCDNSVDEVRAESVFEHLRELIFVLNECHRVLKKDGLLWGVVPVANTDGSLRDPTHVRQFTKSTFDYFTGVNEAKKELPSHPRYADYGIKPWEKVEIKGEGSIWFKLKPRK